MPRKSADQRRADLLAAALRVMADGGVAAGTTRAITAEAGMAPAAFHYCFHTREDMLRALMKQLSANEREAVRAAIQQPAETLEEALAHGLDAFLGHLAENPGQELVLFELNHYALRTPALRDLALEQYRGYYATAAQLLNEIAEAAGIVWQIDPEALARMVVTLLDGVTTTWLADRDTEATRAAAAGFIGYLAGFAAPAVRNP